LHLDEHGYRTKALFLGAPGRGSFDGWLSAVTAE
jgi:hypothetical protein